MICCNPSSPFMAHHVKNLYRCETTVLPDPSVSLMAPYVNSLSALALRDIVEKSSNSFLIVLAGRELNRRLLEA